MIDTGTPQAAASVQWKPNVVVAAVIERDGAFLMVEEEDEEGRIVLNQPAGHLERGETLIEAVRREVLEETAWQFEPAGVVGIYLLGRPEPAITYLRVCFHGTGVAHDPAQPLDHEIVRTVWMTGEELLAARERHRSPLVMTCVNDYLAGRRYPLEVLQHLSAGSE